MSLPCVLLFPPQLHGPRLAAKRLSQTLLQVLKTDKTVSQTGKQERPKDRQAGKTGWRGRKRQTDGGKERRQIYYVLLLSFVRQMKAPLWLVRPSHFYGFCFNGLSDGKPMKPLKKSLTKLSVLVFSSESEIPSSVVYKLEPASFRT